jgi:hypothetical protein
MKTTSHISKFTTYLVIISCISLETVQANTPKKPFPKTPKETISKLKVASPLTITILGMPIDCYKPEPTPKFERHPDFLSFWEQYKKNPSSKLLNEFMAKATKPLPVRAWIDQATELVFSTITVKNGHLRSALKTDPVSFSAFYSVSLQASCRILKIPMSQCPFNRRQTNIFGKKYIIGITNRITTDFDSWTERTNGTILFFERDNLSLLRLTKLVAHEIAMFLDARADLAKTWMDNNIEQSIDVDELQALSDPYISLAFRSMRAFDFEYKVINDLKKIYNIPSDPDLQKFKKYIVKDEDSCIETLKWFVRGFQRSNINPREIVPTKTPSIIKPKKRTVMQKIDIIEDMEIEYKNKKGATTRKSLCMYFSEYELTGNYMLTSEGPRPRIRSW